jgi:hypothetical protein
MRLLLCLCLWLVPSGYAHSQATRAQADYELLYFTQDLALCKPCIPVKAMVDQLKKEGRAVTVYNYQQDPKPFRYYWPEGAQTPSFILLKDGDVYRRYVPDKERNLIFTIDFLRGIAPPDRSRVLDEPRPSTSRDCARPNNLRNILTPPPPPAPGLPKDVPDREKVERIQRLEATVRDLQLTLSVLQQELADITGNSKGETGPAGRDGVDGKDGADGRPGPAGRDGVDGKPGERGADGRDGIDGRDGSALSADSLRELRQLRADVAAMKSLQRRFLIVDGNKILGDLTYEPGEPVVIDRKVILLGE